MWTNQSYALETNTFLSTCMYVPDILYTSIPIFVAKIGKYALSLQVKGLAHLI